MEEPYIEGSPTEEDLARYTKFEEEIRALFKKHGFHVGFYYAMQAVDVDFKGPIGKSNWGFIDGMYIEHEMNELCKRHQKQYKEWLAGTVELDNETLRRLFEINSAIVTIYNQMVSEGMVIIPRTSSVIQQISEHLGMDKARIVPLKQSVEYYVFTRTGTKYQLNYNEDFQYFLKKVEGAPDAVDPPEGPMHFIGNVQLSGNIFHKTGDYPLASTGDKMLFAEWGSPNTAAFITSEVTDVIEVKEVN